MTDQSQSPLENLGSSEKSLVDPEKFNQLAIDLATIANFELALRSVCRALGNAISQLLDFEDEAQKALKKQRYLERYKRRGNARARRSHSSKRKSR